MDKIPLRTYLKEIENLVDRGENDQAIAHCRHILKAYPKNLATYRLLGKALLENRRYGDAADVFQRVLSGVPDDFVSHVGMSIIREDEGNQDAAIWHMERAFEVQPYNSAIQDELRRLYGRRDGLEPPKVRLTRGALARMYARGNLYQQAIGELRAALSEDPQRSDLQVMLARMYFMAGQKVEAVETCSSLLKKLPYCLEANRVISAILPETERKEETQVYRERVMALDPYLVLASPFETTADNVRDQVVVIEKLDYKEGQLEEASQPAWAASLGVSFDELRSSEEPVPDWLQAISQDQAPAKKREPSPTPTEQTSREEIPLEDLSSESAGLLPGEEQEEELPSWISFPDQPSGAGKEKAAAEIPDWMKEAGWETSTSASEGALPPFEYPEEGEADISGITKAELPPWLQAIAPEGLDPSTTPSAEEASQEFMPWLQDSGSESQLPTPEVESDWLEELGEQPAEAPSEVPDWLGELGEGAPSAGQEDIQAEPAQEIPEWLKETAGEADEASVGGEGAPSAEQGVRLELPISEAEPAEEMPDWLKEIEAAPEEQELADEEPAVAVESVEETPTEEALPAEEAPEWVEEAEAEPAEQTVAVEEPIIEVEAIQETPTDEEAPDRLEEIEAEPAEQAVAEEEPVTQVEAIEETPQEEEEPAEEVPEWLEELEGEPDEGPIAEEEAPATQVEAVEETPEEEEAPVEEVPEWLEELEGEPGEEATTEEEAPAEEIPAWLQELGVTPLEAGLGDEEIEGEDLAPFLEEAAQSDEIPDWLKGFQEGSTVPALDEEEIEPGGIAGILEEAEAAEEIPDWIREMGTGQLGEMAADLEGPPDSEATTKGTEAEEAEELDWLQIIGEEPMGAETAFTSEAGTSAEVGQDDYSSADLEALLADTQPVRIGEAAQVVPFNEILEEIDAGTPGEAQAEDVEEAPVEEAGEIPVAVTESPLEETLPEEAEQIPEEGEARGTEEAEQALAEEFEVPVEQDEAVTAEAGAEAAAEVTAFDLEDQDASLAWLESLAAKHGVAEEELFTRPEERPVETPAWIEQERAEAGEPAEEAEPIAEIESGEPSETDLEMEVPEPGELLEGVDLEEIGMVEELEESAFTLPDWSQETESVEEAPAEEELPEEKPDWLKALQAEDLEEPTAPPAIEIESQVEPAEAEAEEIAEAELPDWLRAVQQEADQELAQAQGKQEIDASADLDDADAAMAWLESLAAKQGVPEEELFTAPEQRTETPPEWVEEIAEAEPELAASEAPVEEPPVETPTLEEPLQIPVPDEQEALEVELTEAMGEPPGVEIEAPGLEEPELPEWLAETEAEEIPEEEWTPPVEPVKAALREPRHGTAPLTQPPTEPLNVNKASLVDLEILPGVGFILAQNILTYRDAFGQYVTVDDLIKVPGITPGILAEIREYLMVPAAEQAPPPVEPEMLAEAQSALILARNRLAEGDVEGTVTQYSKLIKNRELLPEIIRDLKEALYRFPVDISLWQTLGDAYMRSDQLTEALEAYTKAEELLR